MHVRAVPIFAVAGACTWVCTAHFACSTGSAASSTDAPVSQPTQDSRTASDARVGITLPPVDPTFDYQLGTPYSPPPRTSVLARDRTAAPVPGLYNICYINGFQLQPGEETWWQANHPALILRDGSGTPIVDPNWNEMLFDVRTANNRSALAAAMAPWFRDCRAKGFAAVEIDNLDSYTRSGNLLAASDAVAMMQAFSTLAHQNQLAIAQKNAAELLPMRTQMQTDFAVVESCNEFSECNAYIEQYGNAVLMIEYQRTHFSRGCASYPGFGIVLRDLQLTAPGNGAYVFDAC